MHPAWPWIAAPILATTLWHLLALATLTQAIWSRYPQPVLRWARCPACAGTWYTALLFGLLAPNPDLGQLVLAGLWGTFWVPLLGWLHYHALAGLYDPGTEDDAPTGGDGEP